MKISFRPFNAATIADSQLMARWDSDPEIRHLMMPFKNEEGYLRPVSAEEIWKKQKKFVASADQREQWMVLIDDDRVVGCGSIEIDPPHCLSVLSATSEDQTTSWMGLTIGEAFARGRGVGKRLLAHLEERARLLGATHAEAGVFEFNAASVRLFTGAGYRQFGKVPELTWWNGRRWDDLRFLKKLGAGPFQRA